MYRFRSTGSSLSHLKQSGSRWISMHSILGWILITECTFNQSFTEILHTKFSLFFQTSRFFINFVTLCTTLAKDSPFWMGELSVSNVHISVFKPDWIGMGYHTPSRGWSWDTKWFCGRSTVWISIPKCYGWKSIHYQNVEGAITCDSLHCGLSIKYVIACFAVLRPCPLIAK
jgi:hypothetical protein